MWRAGVCGGGFVSNITEKTRMALLTWYMETFVGFLDRHLNILAALTKL